jgi:hypothetical protein
METLHNKVLETICSNVVGAQDIALCKLSGKRIQYNSKSPKEQFNFNFNGKITHLVPLQKDKALANFKIEGDWEYVLFLVEGQRFDKLYKKSQLNTFEFLENGYCFPHTEYHKLELILLGNEYNITYDIIPFKELETGTEFLIKSVQYTGEERLGENINSFKLHFNHPVEKLTAFTDKQIKRLELKLFENYIFPFTKINDLKWELHFEKTLNFSVLDINEVYIICYSPDPVVVDVFATTHHIVRFLCGMAGLLFSK